ncbi:serine hydrolase [Microbacterium elymi]|uniref:Serine hydrolase n=1 Tax=Microbacterium elymi TaxID=2909587 RepID=A0ABY5NIK8_9MICO|nr:serine hydrolase [Microbacterium elymi]UUT34997.1 serine hydrolase [Microbacterium elymi]
MIDSVLISGAGIAGPVLASLLARRGVSVTVVESADGVRPGGQAVDLRGAGRTVLDRMGLLEQARSIALDQRGIADVDAQGKHLSEMRATDFGGEGIISEIEILRGDLADLLVADSVSHGAEYLFGTRIVALTDLGDGVRVELNDGSTREADIVVGADGPHSATRRRVFGSAEEFVRPLGGYMAWFTCPEGEPLDDWYVMYNRPGGLAASLRPGRLPGTAKASLAFTSPPLDYDRHDLAQQRALIAARFHGAGWRTAELVDAAAVAEDFYLDALVQVRMPSWSRGRITESIALPDYDLDHTATEQAVNRAAHPRCRGLRRWVRGAVVAVVVLGAIVLGMFGWAYASTDTSTVARVLAWQESDIGDQHRFPARTIPTSAPTSPLPAGAQIPLNARGFSNRPDETLAEALREAHTRAFLVIHHDRIVYERYFDGSGPQTTETSFSVAKSFVSTLVGIAIEQGRIRSIDDPVTDYVPELARREPRFTRITLRDLMTMTSGLAYHESGFPWPFGDDTYTYLGIDLRQVALDRSTVENPPGQQWLYNNYNPLLLGLVLERATGMHVSDYMSSALWQPLGAAHDATWNLDSTASGFEKMESGLNATARDYARFGLLFLHDGEANGQQIVPAAWIRTATAPHVDTPWSNSYGYFWWIDGHRTGSFYAFGDYGQYIYIDRDSDTVIVRTGSDWGTDNPGWLRLFHDVTDQLTRHDLKSGSAGTP